MNTTVQKFKALLKAGKDSDIESILKKCSLDEMRKFALTLKTSSETEIFERFFGSIEIGFISEILTALDKRRFEKNLLLNRKKGLRF